MAVTGEHCTLLINSFDSYEDCWGPFFILLDRYWPDNPFRVVLVSDQAKYESESIISIAPGKLGWSANLIAALSQIETPYVLYMQEDYLIESPVDTKRVLKCIEILQEKSEVAYLELTPYGARSKGSKSNDGLCYIPWYSRYRTSTQAALWRREDFLRLLRDWESGWEFELYGALRSRLIDASFCGLPSNSLKIAPIINYTPTAIIKGRWASFAKDLLAEENINVNFESRGFYKDPGRFKRRFDLLLSLMRRPVQQAKSILSIFRL